MTEETRNILGMPIEDFKEGMLIAAIMSAVAFSTTLIGMLVRYHIKEK